MDFPRGMGEPFPIAYGTGVTIGVDGYYSITFYEDKKDLEESIPGIKQLQSRRVTRSAKRIGNYDAEEIIIENLEHGFTTHSVVIDTRKGHFVLHYQPQISGDPYVAHMLSSFRILDDQQNLPL